MAELGAIASVVGLAGAGIKLSKTLYQMGSKAVSAEHNINRIATNVALFSSMLKHFGSVLKDSEALHSPECLATADQIVRECDLVFEEITNMAVRATSAPAPNGRGDAAAGPSTNTRKRRLSTALHRVKWYFEQPTVERLIAQLEYLKTTLSVLVQTLNLAAVTASAKALGQLSEKVTQEINNERMHVETLIMARQLSIIILHQYNQNVNMREPAQNDKTDGHEVTGRISPATTEDTLDLDEHNSGPKLLTQKANDSADIVKVGGGNLAFLDRAMDPANSMFSSPIAPTHNQIIDQLLGRWTRLPQLEEEMNLKQQQQQQQQQQQRPLSVEGSDFGEPFELVNATRASSDQSPALERATSVLSLESSNPSEKIDAQPYAPAPSHAANDNNNSNNTTTWLDPALTVRSPDPVKAVNLVPSASIPISRNSSTARAPSPSTPIPSPNTGTQMKGIGPPPRSNTSRSSTTTLSPYTSNKSESAYPPTANNSKHLPSLSIDPSSGGSQPPRGADFLASPVSTVQSRAGPSPGTSPNMTSTTMSYYTSSRRNPPEDLSTNTQQKLHTAAQPSPPSSSHTTDESSDEEEDGNRVLGLGIPWRIRIGQKYYDFLDARLVGPRTPYLPTEPMSWVYSHDNAQTEISGAWVCEEAIHEKKYSYSPLQLSDGSAHGEGGRSSVEGSTMWRIALPLKFAEVEDLVEKTIKIFRQKTSQNTTQEASLPRSVGQSRKTSYNPAIKQQQQQQRLPEWDRSPRSSGETFGSSDRALPGSAPGFGSYWSQQPVAPNPKYQPQPPPQAIQATPQQPKAMGGILSGAPAPVPTTLPPPPPPGGAAAAAATPVPPPNFMPPAPIPPPPGAMNFVPQQTAPPLQHAYSDMSVPRYGAPPGAPVMNENINAYATGGRDVPFSPSLRFAYPDWSESNPPKETYYNSAPRDPRGDNYYNQTYRRDVRGDGYLDANHDQSRTKSRDRHTSTRNNNDDGGGSGGRPRSSRGESRHGHHHSSSSSHPHKSSASASHHGGGGGGGSSSSRRRGEEKSSGASGKLVSGRTMAKLAGLAAMLEGLDGL